MPQTATETKIARIIIEDPFVVCPHCGTPLPFEGDIKITQSADLVCTNPECGESVTLFLTYQVIDVLDFDSNAPFIEQVAAQTKAYRTLRKKNKNDGAATP